MDIRHLRHFVAVAEELCVSAAARRLHISQPPLSRSIRAIEASLGATLFNRTHGRLELTAAGQALLSRSYGALQQFNAALDGARAAARHESTTLRIGYMALSLLHPFTAEALRRLRQRLPDCKLVLTQLHPRAQLEALSENRVHVGLVYRQEGGVDLDRMEAFDEAVSVVIPATHRLARKRLLRLADIKDEPVVWMSRDSSPSFYDAFAASLEAQGFHMQIRERVDSLPMAFAMVASGAGISFAPASAQGGWFNTVVTRPALGLGARFQADWIWRKGGEAGPLSEFLCIVHDLRRQSAMAPLERHTG